MLRLIFCFEELFRSLIITYALFLATNSCTFNGTYMVTDVRRKRWFQFVKTSHVAMIGLCCPPLLSISSYPHSSNPYLQRPWVCILKSILLYLRFTPLFPAYIKTSLMGRGALPLHVRFRNDANRLIRKWEKLMKIEKKQITMLCRYSGRLVHLDSIVLEFLSLMCNRSWQILDTTLSPILCVIMFTTKTSSTYNEWTRNRIYWLSS